MLESHAVMVLCSFNPSILLYIMSVKAFRSELFLFELSLFSKLIILMYT